MTWRKLTGVFPRNKAVYDRGLVTLIDAEKSHTGPYECTARNYLGEASAVTTVVVWSPPKFIIRPPGRIFKPVGQHLSLQCTANAQDYISWRRVRGAWEKGRMKVQNGTLEISSLKMSDSGSYICEAKPLFYRIEATTVLEVAGK